jgi:hypothetical protein
LNITGNAITMEAKVRLSGETGNHWILCKQDISSIRSYGFYIATHSRTAYPSIETTNGLFEGEVGTGALSYDTWYHVAVVSTGTIAVSNDVLLFGSYDCDSGFDASTVFYGEISDPLTDGTYRLVVQMSDGAVVERSSTFQGQSSLPIVRSGTFELSSSPSGDLSEFIQDFGLTDTCQVIVP